MLVAVRLCVAAEVSLPVDNDNDALLMALMMMFGIGIATFADFISKCCFNV